MKRLTKRNEFGEVIRAKPLKSTYIVAIDEEIREQNQECLNRLAEHEDKLESGQLVEKPHNKEVKTIKFILNGCDISFLATAPADMTVEQLVKQASRINPDWCACGICDYYGKEEPQIVFDYDDVHKVSEDVSCSIENLKN